VAKARGEKAKVLQILVNLIRNAKYACDDSGGADKIITLVIQPGAPGRVQITVRDNGIGIPPENLTRIFQHGFTTRSKGHGFGLHSARIAAGSINATVTAESAGIGRGAAFTLDLPVMT
jgi:signal transduction histidine kinase